MGIPNQTEKYPYRAETVNLHAVKSTDSIEIPANDLHVSSLQSVNQAPMHEEEIMKWSPKIVALLSFLIPGAGQMYKGNVGAGFLWLIFVTVGYCLLLVPGIILHLICISTALSGDPYR